MRKLMWFTLGFGAGCGLCAYGLPKAWLLPGLCILAGFFLLSLLVSRKWVRAAGILLLGWAVSLGWYCLYHQHYLAPASALDGVAAEAVITVTDYSYETDYGIAFDGKLEIAGKSYQVKTYLNEKTELSPGDLVAGTFRFRLTTGEGEKDATHHSGKGIFLLAYQRGEAVIQKTETAPDWTLPAKLRKGIKSIVDACFPEDLAPFAKGLLLGDTTSLSYELDTAFKLSGIRHVVAVSGLHISILFALLTTVTFRKRYLTAILGIPVLMLFAAIAGFSPSVIRACIMSAMMLLASVFNREYDGSTALSFAVLIMLVMNPLAVTSVSLQLSVASVAGIFCFREPIQTWISGKFRKQKGRTWKIRLLRWFTGSVSVSLSALVFTTPLSAWYFGTVSLIGPVTNLMTLWVISFVFYGIMAVCLTFLIWETGAILLARVICIPIRYVLLTAKILGRLPLAAVYTQSVYIVIWLVFCYLLLLIFLVQKNREPLVLGCCACLGLCFSLLLSWWEPMLDDARMTILDVGQGQAILLQTEGRSFLVDCGGDSDTQTADLIAGTLLSQGVTRLDGIILSHYDRDHAGALENLLTRIPTELLLVPDTKHAPYDCLSDGRVCCVSDTLELTCGGTKITVFAPIYDGEDNENSMCVLFERENCVILITGDRSAFGERMLMRKTKLPDVDVLIAGHHGSKYSTSEELISAVEPEIVMISVGKDNSYGHPAPELLQRLQESGCTVYRTDLHGTIVYRR